MRGCANVIRLALEGDTLVARLDTEGLAYPIVIDPVWRPAVNNLPMSNNQMQVVRTSTGRVFAIAPSTPNFAELNVATETWASAGNAVVNVRSDAAAVPLSNGKILLAGGGSGLKTAELFTPGSGSVATGDMIGGRARAAAVVLPSPERVLVIGGGSGTGGSTGVEVYDVAAGTWTARAALPQPRSGMGAIRLATGPHAGQVLVVGGNDSGTQYASALRYDPASDGWVTLGTSLQTARHFPQVVALPSGKILIAGGDTYAYDPTVAVDVYDPTTDTLAPGPAMTSARTNFRLERLADGKILAIGGYSGSAARATTEIFDETTNTWSAGPSLANARYDLGSVTLPYGRVIVAGGASATNTSEIFYPTPVPCTTSGPGCASCVDGVCCDSACTGQCQACDTAGREGYCFAVVGEAPHGTRPACTPTTICGTTGACATTCASDGACATGFYCAGTSCSAKKPNGSACVGANECTSGQCVDGYCCNAACGEQCKACDVAGSLGTCTDVAGSPHGARLACASGFGCSAGACATTCTTSAQCASDRACDTSSGTCVTKRGLGALCASALDCATGFCVDGLCCDKPCTESCFACDVSGTQVHTPPTHVFMPGHDLPHAPQLSRSVFRSLHPVEHGVRSRAQTQVPLLQRGLSLGHTAPHVPQLLGSVPSWTHLPEHSVPVAHLHAEKAQT